MKIIIKPILLLMLGLLSATTFAKNECITNIDSHVRECGGFPGTHGPFYHCLELVSCDLQDRDMKAVVSYIHKRGDIDMLSLAKNHITEKGVRELDEGILKFMSLGLSDNELGDKGALVVAGLKGDKGSLDLANNNISEQGAQALAKNTTWEQLNLDNNHVGDAGFMALTKNKSITWLSLSNNGITNIGALAFVNALRDRSQHLSFVSLDVTKNHIGYEGVHKLHELRDIDHILWNIWTQENDG